MSTRAMPSPSPVHRVSPSTTSRTSISVSAWAKTGTSIHSPCFRRGTRRALPRLPRRRPHQLLRRSRSRRPRLRAPRIRLRPLLRLHRHPQRRAPSPPCRNRSPSTSRRSPPRMPMAGIRRRPLRGIGVSARPASRFGPRAAGSPRRPRRANLPLSGVRLRRESSRLVAHCDSLCRRKERDPPPHGTSPVGEGRMSPPGRRGSRLPHASGSTHPGSPLGTTAALQSSTGRGAAREARVRARATCASRSWRSSPWRCRAAWEGSGRGGSCEGDCL